MKEFSFSFFFVAIFIDFMVIFIHTFDCEWADEPHLFYNCQFEQIVVRHDIKHKHKPKIYMI